MRKAKEILKNNTPFDYTEGVYYLRSDDALEAMEAYADQFRPKWISVGYELPEIDESDQWKKANGISKTVPVIEKGVLNLGFYNYPLEAWQVNGRIGNIEVTEWFDLPEYNISKKW